MEFESWIDRQIREAMERGAFDNLPGAGKPLHLDPDPDWWAKAKIADENLEPLLPTALSLVTATYESWLNWHVVWVTGQRRRPGASNRYVVGLMSSGNGSIGPTT